MGAESVFKCPPRQGQKLSLIKIDNVFSLMHS
jgi:hypothetical protein